MKKEEAMKCYYYISYYQDKIYKYNKELKYMINKVLKPRNLFALLVICSFISIVICLLLAIRDIDNLSAKTVIYENKKYAKRLPNALIIGSRKCGTRALMQFLKLNKYAKLAVKESHFFNNDTNFKRGIDWYLDRMPYSRLGDMTIEKTPAYFVTKKSIERIKSIYSEQSGSLKLVLVVRNPTIRVISDFSQLAEARILKNLARVKLNLSKSINLTLEENKLWEDEARLFQKLILTKTNNINTKHKLIIHGIYAEHIRHWLNGFNRNKIHLVDGENLIRDPYIEMKKLESFLGLPSMISKKDFVFVKQKGFYCCLLKVEGKEKSESKAMNDSLSNITGEKLKKLECLGAKKGRRHIDVSEELVTKLNKFYLKYNKMFEIITNRSFNWYQDTLLI